MINFSNFSIGSCVVASVDFCFRNTHRDRGMASLRRSHAHTHHLDEWREADLKCPLVRLLSVEIMFLTKISLF